MATIAAPRTQSHRQNGSQLRTRRHSAVQGNARQNYERYLACAREAHRAGDPIEMENCYQHAEHYLRMMTGVSEQ
jgi:Domain of unknown function (DUF4167)